MKPPAASGSPMTAVVTNAILERFIRRLLGRSCPLSHLSAANGFAGTTPSQFECSLSIWRREVRHNVVPPARCNTDCRDGASDPPGQTMKLRPILIRSRDDMRFWRDGL